MGDLAIRVDRVGKCYRIGQREPYKTLRETLVRAMAPPFRRQSLPNDRQLSSKRDILWALQDVTFNVMRGEVLGLIGSNGAGKTTLLKVLSRIANPTTGMAEIHGRVGSLLEVGTGFHPELTGRENIYLNGAILGMRRAEINRQFDAIVAFAEIAPFIDTPVKRYSSGMYVRLAFAVAAHFEPDILLIDEVLAVGDAAFQEKCLGRMSKVSAEGRTILFISHNMEAVLRLCTRVIWLNQGRLMLDSSPEQSVGAYLEQVRARSIPLRQGMCFDNHPGRRKPFDGLIRLTSCQILNDEGRPSESIATGTSCRVRLGYQAFTSLRGTRVNFALTFRGEGSHRLASCWSQIASEDLGNLEGAGEVECHIPKLSFVPGRYVLDIGCQVASAWSDMVHEAAILNVSVGSFYPSGRLPTRDTGQCLMEYVWSKADAGLEERTASSTRCVNER